MTSARDAKKYHSGFDDKLKPMEALDLSKIKDFDELLRAMEKTAFGGRKLGEAAETLFRMITDKDAFVVLTLSGAMTVAKMGLVICEMIDRGFIHAIVSTGALITHGFVESAGMTHFKYDPKMNDKKLYGKGYNRIYDTIELEKNLDDAEKIIDKILDDIDQSKTLSSHLISRKMGKWLVKNTNKNSKAVLKSAFLKNVPVFIPAMTDSELALDIAVHNRREVINGKKPFSYDSFLDLEYYAELINNQRKLGIFTIGGGVPRNWAQQVGPYLDVISRRLPEAKNIKKQKFTYALRICPEPVNWGGLSGCTYSEGISWGKFKSENDGGRHSEVLEDATVVWPLLIKAVIQRLEKAGIKKVKKNFSLK